MRTLITGAMGVSGKALLAHLARDANLEIFQTDFDDCDLSSAEATVGLIKRIRPQQVYHLAGSMTNEFNTDYVCNVVLTKNVLDALLAQKLSARVLLIGSAAEYGVTNPTDNPVKESHPLRPVSVYGLTKVMQSELMRFYVRLYDLDIVLARTFNLLAEGLSTNLFVGKLHEAIRAYQGGEIRKITLGNLQNRRDYIHITDAVADYVRIMNKGKKGETYNVGSGASIKMRRLAARILADHGLDIGIVEETISTDPNKLDISDIYADVRKIRRLRNK